MTVSSPSMPAPATRSSTIGCGSAPAASLMRRAVARALDFAPERPKRWIVAGGGTRNRELFRLLRQHLAAEVTSADEVGWSSAFLEAQAFAYMAVRSLKGFPLTYPNTTGVPEPTTGGIVARPGKRPRTVS